MMLRSQTERLARRLTSSSPLRRRIPVSFCHRVENQVLGFYKLTFLLDVIVLTAMGEQAAIEAKEAPRN